MTRISWLLLIVILASTTDPVTPIVVKEQDRIDYCFLVSNAKPIDAEDCFVRARSHQANFYLWTPETDNNDSHILIGTCVSIRKLRLWSNAYVREVARMMDWKVPKPIRASVSEYFADRLEPCELGGVRPVAYGSRGGRPRGIPASTTSSPPSC